MPFVCTITKPGIKVPVAFILGMSAQGCVFVRLGHLGACFSATVTDAGMDDTPVKRLD